MNGVTPLEGLAERETRSVSEEDTSTVADCEIVPPGPVQLAVNVVVVNNAPVFQEVVVVARELPFQ